MEKICFVIQPFDNGGKYDKRYLETFAPAISEAGFKPSRVDEDPSASILIEQIERGIREAAVCFAEISEDRPNVWFELGLAIAHAKDVCLVCNQERERFPFDVQHRQIIRYAINSPSDFQSIRKKIVDRLKALAKKQESISELPSILERAPGDKKLPDHEITALGVLAGELVTDASTTSILEYRRIMETAGYTAIAANAAVRALRKSGLLLFTEEEDEHGYPYGAIRLSPQGWEWVDQNIERAHVGKVHRWAGVACHSGAVVLVKRLRHLFHDAVGRLPGLDCRVDGEVALRDPDVVIAPAA